MISLTTAALSSGTRAASAYAEARAAAAPSAAAPSGIAGSASQAAQEFVRIMDGADQATVGAMQGRTDTQALVQSIAEAQMAMETAVAIRDRVVEAYQEILRMPV